MKKFCLSLILGSVFFTPAVAEINTEPDSDLKTVQEVSIGILSYRGTDKAIKRWSATADYLSNNIPDYHFNLMPLNLMQMADAVEQEKIQFVLTNPGHYVKLESNFGISRIATMQSLRSGKISTRFGAVIFTKSSNRDIHNLEDLDGKSFMSVSQHAFGGFQMAWRELDEHGLDPFNDFSRLEFVGFPQDQIVQAVYDNHVDAGSVRAETLLRMVEVGRYNLSDFRILNQKKTEGAHTVLSTRLYPEWPFSKNKNTSRDLAIKVTLALLAMPIDHPAALKSQTAGWTVPLDYSPVHELMQSLRIGPYEVLRETTLSAIAKKYAGWLIGVAMFVALLILLVAFIARTNQKLLETDKNLRKEITERKQSQIILAEYKDTLEERVKMRTEEIHRANESSQKSQIALHKLVNITSAPRLSHEEKLIKLLEAGREYYQTAMASLSNLKGDSEEACTVTGKGGLLQSHAGPLSESCIHQAVERYDVPLDLPDMQKCEASDKFKSYLATAVLVGGKPHSVLEFADTERRNTMFTHWDHNILQVMAQWIGSEIEKQSAIEQKQQNQYELARVGRMSAMGEMAAGLAHELNQPLTGAINYSNGCLRRLRQDNFNREELVEGLERTIEGATLAADIIRQLREFVQKGNTEQKLTDLNSVVINIVDLVSTEIKRYQTQVSLDLDNTLPNIKGNSIQLEQVVLNFIRNSLDALESIDPDSRRISISTEQTGKLVRLSVKDNGKGISTDSASKLFDAFYTTKEDGMGMGLSISRSIIEAHGGSISGVNVRNSGACFSFELPLISKLMA